MRSQKRANSGVFLKFCSFTEDLKNKITIFFLAIYLFSVTEAHQVLKIPIIFQHFGEHQEQDKNISLVKFLAMHYLHGSPKDKDYARDMQLPFKTTGDCITAIAPAYIPVTVEFKLERPVELIRQQNFIRPEQFIFSAYPANIWQPPKA